MTPKQQKALLALLTSPTREKAAAAAGITSKTLRGYLADPDFQAEYKRAFSGLVDDAARQAQQALAPALSTLREIVEGTGENAQARISAARSILEYGMKLTEATDILARLDELEKLAEGEEVNRDILKRLERVREALQGRQEEKATLVYADGYQLPMGTLEAVDEICKRDDVVDVLSEDATTRSLLLAMLGPWDFSDVEELAGQ